MQRILSAGLAIAVVSLLVACAPVSAQSGPGGQSDEGSEVPDQAVFPNAEVGSDLCLRLPGIDQFEGWLGAEVTSVDYANDASLGFASCEFRAGAEDYTWVSFNIQADSNAACGADFASAEEQAGYEALGYGYAKDSLGGKWVDQNPGHLEAGWNREKADYLVCGDAGIYLLTVYTPRDRPTIDELGPVADALRRDGALTAEFLAGG